MRNSALRSSQAAASPKRTLAGCSLAAENDSRVSRQIGEEVAGSLDFRVQFSLLFLAENDAPFAPSRHDMVTGARRSRRITSDSERPILTTLSVLSCEGPDIGTPLDYKRELSSYSRAAPGLRSNALMRHHTPEGVKLLIHLVPLAT